MTTTQAVGTMWARMTARSLATLADAGHTTAAAACTTVLHGGRRALLAAGDDALILADPTLAAQLRTFRDGHGTWLELND